MRKLFYTSLLVFTLASCTQSYEHPMEDSLRKVDQALEDMNEYVTLKENRINVISESLSANDLTLQQKHAVYGSLTRSCRTGHDKQYSFWRFKSRHTVTLIRRRPRRRFHR